MIHPDTLRPIVVELQERVDCTPCHYINPNSDKEGDCGNWDTCREECPLRRLRELVGFSPKENGRLGAI